MCYTTVFFSCYISALEGQILELPVLQVYFHLRGDERTDPGGGRVLGGLVHHSRLLHTPHSTRQGQVRICKLQTNVFPLVKQVLIHYIKIVISMSIFVFVSDQLPLLKILPCFNQICFSVRQLIYRCLCYYDFKMYNFFSVLNSTP